MSESVSARYDVHLSLTGLPAGRAALVQERLEAALTLSISEGTVAVSSVTERRPAHMRCPTEQRIVPFSVLYLALPAEFQRAEILDALAAQYHHEVTCLWRTVQDDRCVQGVIELREWRTAGTQWICEFLSYDRSVAPGNTYNFHVQETSQWSNRETGWSGHQGAIVLDTVNGEVSAHH
ncbi:MAG: hypothetical protein JWN14_2647 [Chthonomonadales bacterium]|nr:hypothetical protein [Chthonomonadales bacterium]